MNTKAQQKALEAKATSKVIVAEAAEVANAAENTFIDSLLGSTAYIAMAEKMPAIANKMDSLDRTLIVKTGEITNMAYDFVVTWNALSDGGYALEKDEVREYIYASAKRTGKASEVTSKIKRATGSFASKTTQATRDAMLAFKKVNECSLDDSGHLVAPNNIMRPKINETVMEDDGTGKMIKVVYKDQENTDASLGPVPEAKARIWAVASGINASTGTTEKTDNVQTMQQVRDHVRLIANGNPLDYSMKERALIREMLADLQGAVDQLDCENEDGEVDQALFADITKAREHNEINLAFNNKPS